MLRTSSHVHRQPRRRRPERSPADINRGWPPESVKASSSPRRTVTRWLIPDRAPSWISSPARKRRMHPTSPSSRQAQVEKLEDVSRPCRRCRPRVACPRDSTTAVAINLTLRGCVPGRPAGPVWEASVWRGHALTSCNPTGLKPARRCCYYLRGPTAASPTRAGPSNASSPPAVVFPPLASRCFKGEWSNIQKKIIAPRRTGHPPHALAHPVGGLSLHFVAALPQPYCSTHQPTTSHKSASYTSAEHCSPSCPLGFGEAPGRSGTTHNPLAVECL